MRAIPPKTLPKCAPNRARLGVFFGKGLHGDSSGMRQISAPSVSHAIMLQAYPMKTNRPWPLIFFLLVLASISGFAAETAKPTCGLTIITHGFQPPGKILFVGSDGALPAWVSAMANEINARTGANLPVRRFRYDKASILFGLNDLNRTNDKIVPENGDVDLNISGGAIILLDWVGLADETIGYRTQEVADRFFSELFERAHHGRDLASVPIHLIGHSRGASLNSRLAFRLAERGIIVDQVTTLDPHPVKFVNILPLFDLIQDDVIPEIFENVVFADNYWQSDDYPDGRPVPGATNRSLTGVFTGDFHKGHEWVHTYYHGTIEPTRILPYSVDGEYIQQTWYNNTVPRSLTGYNYSRYGSAEREAAALNQYLVGTSGLAVGTGFRRIIVPDSSFENWPNAGFDQRESIRTSISVGETVGIPYHQVSRRHGQTITFSLDGDTNPFNQGGHDVGSTNFSGRAGGIIKGEVFSWTPTTADVGTRFLRVKATHASGRTRYDYYFKPITVLAAANPNARISMLTPRTLPVLPLPQNQRITIVGSGYTPASTLSFFDGQSTIASNPSKLTYISPTELKYDLAVGSQAGTWTVRVVNGAVESDPASFSVTAATDTTAPAAPLGLSASPWAGDAQFALDWTNPSDASGIARAWVKTGSSPTSATDGIAYPLPANKPLRLALPVSEGSRSVHLWLEDGAGNRDHNTRATVTLGADATIPVVQISSPVANLPPTTQGTITLTGSYSDTLSGVASLQWRNFSAGTSGDTTMTGTSLGGSWTTPSITLTSGLNVIGVTATDAAGNVGAASLQITYVNLSNSGTVTVSIAPAEAVAQGAQWRVNAGEWRNSGQVEQNVPTGPRFIDFKNIPGGFRTPAGFPITVTSGQSLTTNATYTPVFVADPPSIPGNPSPAHGAPSVRRFQPRFAWSGGAASGEVEYAFCLDDTGNPLNPDPPVIAPFGFISRTAYQHPGTLLSATTYNWRVKTRANGITVDGPLWRFTTEYAVADLVASGLSVSGNIEPGAQVTLFVTVKNEGSFVSPGAYVHFYLSRSPGGKEIRLTPNVPDIVPGLQPGQQQTVTFTATLNGLPAGQSFIDAWIDSGPAGPFNESNFANNLQTIQLNYVDGKDPVVPVAGLRNSFVKTGTSNVIEFAAVDGVAIKTLDFYYSMEGGVNWNVIQEGYVPPSPPTFGTTYPWLIPTNLTIGANLQLRVVARDTSGNAGERVSIPYQVRDGTQPMVRIISPNGGEIWGMGSQQPIKWSVSAPNGIGAMQLWFYRNGTVDRIADISAVTSGVYIWTLPSPFATTDGKIQITVDDLNGNHAEDFSDGFFTIRDTSQPPPAPWMSEQPLQSSATAPLVLTADPSGALHLVHGSAAGLQYKRQVNSTWSASTTINTGAGGVQNIRIAADSQAVPHLVWNTAQADTSQYDIFHAWYDGTDWVRENISVDLPGFVGVPTRSSNPDIATDSRTNIHAVWVDGYDASTAQTDIYYRKRDGNGVWATPVRVSMTGAYFPSVAVDAANRIHVAYWTRVDGRFVIHHRSSSDGVTWVAPIKVAEQSQLQLGFTPGIRLATRGENQVDIVWRGQSSGNPGKQWIHYSRFDGAGWGAEELAFENSGSDSAFIIPFLSLDVHGRPHLVVEDRSYPKSVIYRTRNNGQWAPGIKLNIASQQPLDDSLGVSLSPSNNVMHAAWVYSSAIYHSFADVSSTNDVSPPVVFVTEPTAGMNLSVGAPYSARWTAQDDSGVSAVHLHYTTNNGAVWELIATNLTNTGLLNWILPNLSTNTVQIRVTAVDAAANTGVGFSGSFSTVDSTPPTVTITAPPAGAILAGGGSTNILWSAADNGVISGVDLEFSLDNGATWLGMATNLANTGTYPWTVPSVPASTLLLRATARDAAGFSATFTSQPLTIVRGNSPPLAPSSPFPPDGSSFVLTQLPNFRWNSSDPDGDALTYYVRFGSNTNAPVVLTTTASSFNPPALRPQRTYYWQVLATDGKATNAGSLWWSFTTEAGTLPPTSLAEFKRQTNGQFEFRFNGLFGESQVVQASTNLFDWFTVATFGNSNAASVFLDSAATNSQRRFYRVIAP